VLSYQIWSLLIKPFGIRKGSKKIGGAGAPPLATGRGWPLETHSSNGRTELVKQYCAEYCMLRRDKKLFYWTSDEGFQIGGSLTSMAFIFGELLGGHCYFSIICGQFFSWRQCWDTCSARRVPRVVDRVCRSIWQQSVAVFSGLHQKQKLINNFNYLWRTSLSCKAGINFLEINDN